MKLLRIVLCFVIAGGVLSTSSCQRGSGKPKYAFITNNKYDFWIMAESGTKAAAEQLGVEVEFKMGDGSPDQQQRLIKELVNKGVKGIAISPNDAANMVPFFKEKVPSDVPLITQDSDVPDTRVRRCYIGTHNYRAGRAAGKLVTEAAPQGGKIIIFVGKLDVQNAVERRQGVLDYLRDHAAKKKVDEDTAEIAELDDREATDLKVGNYTLIKTQTDEVRQELCQQRASQLLTRHKDVVCLIGLWEYNPPALIRAVQGLPQGQAKPAIVAFDENYETLDGIKEHWDKDKKQRKVHASVVQNPYEFGRQAITLLHGLAKGNESVLTSRKDIDKQNRIFIAHRIITPENVEPFYQEVKKYKGQ